MSAALSITYTSHRMRHILVQSIHQQRILPRHHNRIWIAFSSTTTTTTTATAGSHPDEVDILQPKPPPTKSKEEQQLFFNIPKRLRQKVVGIEDAVSLISNNDTISCSGFVAQGTPNMVIFVPP